MHRAAAFQQTKTTFTACSTILSSKVQIDSTTCFFKLQALLFERAADSSGYFLIWVIQCQVLKNLNSRTLDPIPVMYIQIIVESCSTDIMRNINLLCITNKLTKDTYYIRKNVPIQRVTDNDRIMYSHRYNKDNIFICKI